MSSFLRKFQKTLLHYGIDVSRLKKALTQNNNWFKEDLAQLKQQKANDETFAMAPPYPILTDRHDEGGTMKGHYFHQDLYVARQVFMHNPKRHLDIGSRTDGFVAHVATFRAIEIIDIRDIKSQVKNISFTQADLMQLPNHLLQYCDSISSLHAIEHFGLGRYGDPIDYWGHEKAINNIAQILQPGGRFYFSVPIGPQRIEFNAQRVFSLTYLINLLNKNFQILTFSYVNDAGNLVENAELTTTSIANNCNCHYGCGIFTLTKK